MNDTAVKAKPRYSLPQRIVRIFLKTLVGILAFLILVIILIQTPPVQNFARKKIQSFLSEKLQTKVQIGHLYVGLPKKIILEDVYIEDRQRDTLLWGGKLKVDISLFRLFDNVIEINEINLESVTAKIKRTLPDTVYNFQFIVDAFTPAKQPSTPSDSAAMKMSIDYITLDKIRMVYQDVVTGSDMDVFLEHFDSHIKTFDPATMQYVIPVANLKGVRAKIYQYKPLMVAEPLAKDAAQAVTPIPIDFDFDELDIEDVDIDYRNDVSAFYTRLKLGDLLVRANDIDLQNRVINLQELHLNATQTLITMGRKEAARVAVKEIKKEVELEAQNEWRVIVGTVRLNNNMFQMNDENMPRLRNGMDFAHMKAENVSIHINNLLFNKDSIAGEITKGELKEQSGFTLKTLQTNFLYASNQAYLHDLLLETPGTVLRRSATITYPSIEALSNDISRLQLDVVLDNARIQVKDILTFAPDLRAQPAFSNPNAIWRANGNITGSIANLNFSPLQLQGLQHTRLDITGNISGLPDVNKLRGNLVIRNLLTSRSDIMMLTPKGTIPSTITIPQNINVQGTINGSMTAVNTNLRINTSLGNAAINGTLQNLSSPAKLQYNVQVGTNNLDLGTILQNDSTFGNLSADFRATGRGIDPATANATFNGTIHSAVFNGYNYKNVQLDGKLADQRATASVNIQDPNIDLQLTGTTFLGSKYPSIHIDAFVDSIKTQPLQLTPQSVIYHGRISADFPITDPANLQGELLVTESVLVNEGQRVQFDSIQVTAGRTDSGQFIRVRSDAANIALEGTYNLLQLGTVFQDAIQPYFALVPSYQAVPVDPYNFTIRGTVVNHPTLQTFIPGLERLDPVAIDGRFSNTEGWHMDLTTPMLVFGVNKIEGIQFNAGTGKNGIAFEATMNKFSSGTAMNIYRTTVGGTVANNQINFNLNIQDKTNKNKYQLAGLMQQPSLGNYAVSFRQDSLLLNYDRWTVAQGNSINFGTSGIFARDFVLSKGPESLSVNSLTPSGNAPVEVRFTNFQIGTILGFVQSDTLLADGAINGGVVLNNLMTQPTFTGDLTIQDLSVKNDTVGNLRMIVNNTVRNKYTADVRLTGFGNDLQLSGEYNVLPNNNSYYDLVLDVRALQLASLEGLSMGAYYNGEGYVSGKFLFNGSLKDPNVDGNLNFFNAGFTPTALGSHFKIEKESILLMNNQGVKFNTFTVKDSLGNTAVLDGMAYTNNFFNYKFDLTLRVRDFQALNTVKAPKKLYYGQLFFSSNMTITGTEKAPVIDGNLTINDKTKLTVVLPQKQVGVVDREGIVEFVDMDSLSRDSLFLVFDTLNKSSLIGFDIALNVEVSKAAELTVVVDQGTGDFLRMRGEGLLTAGIDPSGKITLSGSYEIEDGAYELSFNFLKRRFLLQKGSRIVWSGEPADAELDVTAIYVANTAPIDLVSNYIDQPVSELVIYRQKLPFEVYLMLDGPLMKPEISFDVVLPEKNYGISNDIVTTVNYRLEEIRQQPSELNKQVFALLLLNRFVGENPFESSNGGGGIDAGTFARQSVSRLLTEQLNQLAGNLIQGVDINFDLVTTEDYTQGYMENRTDFNVALSKRLLDDRLTVSVGSNFELEGPQHANQSGSNIAGNISVDYLLSKDGKYKLRAYRKNEYEGVVEGYIIETGVGFSITLEYNRFRNLFRKPRQNRRNAPPRPEPGDPVPATVTQPGAVSKNENEFPWP